MKTKKILTTLAVTSLVATGASFAQDANQPGQMPQQGQTRPGMMREFRQEKHENIRDSKERMMQARDQFRNEMEERKEFMHGSTTPGMATPTPWKNFRENVKDIKNDFRDEMRDDRQEFKMQRPLNATATAAIALRLGITPENLQAQLASGTKLKEIIKNKIPPEEMKQILPPRVATFTKRIEDDGFFANIRSKLFGPRQEVMERKVDEYGQVTEATSTEKVVMPFWKRFFGF